MNIIKKFKIKGQFPEEAKNTIRTYTIFIWHGAFLALTMSMLDFNTVSPRGVHAGQSDSIDQPRDMRLENFQTRMS